MRTELRFGVQLIGIVGFVPYVAACILSIASGLVASHYIHGGADRTLVRKIALSLGELIPAAAILVAAYVVSRETVVVMLVLSVGFGGLQGASFGANHMDVAPQVSVERENCSSKVHCCDCAFIPSQYAAMTLAVANSIAACAGIFVSLAVGRILDGDRQDMAHWRVVFFLSAVVEVCGWAFYMLYGSGRRVQGLSAPRIHTRPSSQPTAH